MSLTGIWAADMFDGVPRGIIGGGEQTFLTAPQKFDKPSNVMCIPVLQSISETSDKTSARCFVAEYVDGGVKHTGNFVGIVASKCTSVTWGLYCQNCFASALRVIVYL